MRVLGVTMMLLQIVTTILFLPLVVIGGPVIWFFWWVAFITWVVCVLAGGRRIADREIVARDRVLPN
jgi:hypothetical protein